MSKQGNHLGCNQPLCVLRHITLFRAHFLSLFVVVSRVKPYIFQAHFFFLLFYLFYLGPKTRVEALGNNFCTLSCFAFVVVRVCVFSLFLFFAVRSFDEAINRRARLSAHAKSPGVDTGLFNYSCGGPLFLRPHFSFTFICK